MHLHIVGLGVNEHAELEQAAKSALQGAEYIVGSERQLATLDTLLQTHQQQILLPKLSDLKKQLIELAAQGIGSVVILASGDPLL